MIRSRGLAAAAAALALPVAAGCGFGEGESSEGEAELRVTRDYGTEALVEATVADPPESETVMRALDAEADVETRYGGRFVQSIDGVEGGVEDGRSFDWFFYVDGIESPVGAADVAAEPGARIWWDYRDWTDVMRVPAVVGSFPQPFAQEPVVLDCAITNRVCKPVVERLEDAGVELDQFGPEDATGDEPRMLVGEWDRIREDGAAAVLDAGPQGSGVFARFERDGGGWSLELLDVRADRKADLGPGAGLVAAVREGDAAPVWLVTGTDEEGVEHAAELLDEDALRDRYAVATEGSERVALPVVEGG